MTVEQNIELLKSFKEFKNGWLGRESEPIDIKYIDIALKHIDKFLIQPNVDSFDSGVSFTWPLLDNNLVEINISENIEFIVWLDDDISTDTIIEEKFISQYANRVLKQQLKNA